MHTVKIRGIIATDASGVYASEGQPVGFRHNPLTRKLDQAILRNVVSESLQRESRPVIVLGRNTHDELRGTELGKLISNREMATKIISDPKGLTVEQFDRHPVYSQYPTDVDPKVALLEMTLAWCYRHGVREVIVLGGRSVYHAFAGHYYEFHHCMFKRIKPAHETKSLGIEVNSETGSEPSLMRTRYTYTLIDTPNLSYRVHTLGERS